MAAAPDCRYALGLTLLASLALGGGTATGLAIDAVLQILVIACSTYVLVRLWDRPALKGGLAFFGLVACAGAIQLIPLPTGLLHAMRPEVFLPVLPGEPGPPGAATISLTASRTVLSVTFALVPAYFFLAASRLPSVDLIGLIPFYLAGVLFNLTVAILQIATSSGITAVGLLGYEVTFGVFTNGNHFATLLFSSIPIIVYLGLVMNRRIFAATTLILILVTLLAAGSRAGILIGLAVSVISIASLAWRERRGGILAVLVLMVLVAVFSYGAFVRIDERAADPQFGRIHFALTTLEGIRDNWLLGIGYGVFEMLFPHYEAQEAIQREYVNHAHNDFLEVVFEGGLMGLAIIVFYMTALVRRALKIGSRPLQRLVTLSILMVLVHSLVDYPLRTMAIAMAFAFFNALLFSDAAAAPASERRSAPDERRRRRRRASSREAA